MITRNSTWLDSVLQRKVLIEAVDCKLYKPLDLYLIRSIACLSRMPWEEMIGKRSRICNIR